MAAGNSRRDLFLQVSGTVEPLRNTLSAGKSALVEFAGDAAKQLDAVEKSLRDLASGDPAKTAKQLTASYTAAFREIKRNAQEVLNADTGTGAMTIVNANAARQAADAAEQRAAAVRVVAQAAREEALAQGATNTALTQYAAAALVAEKEATDYAIALREQANTLTAVEGRMGAIVAPGKRVTEMSGQMRAGMQQLGFQLGDVATQMAAGTPASIIFAQQIGQVTQALGLMTAGSSGFLASLGLWGPVIGAALVFLTPWVAKMFEGNSEIDKAVKKLGEEAAQAEVTRRAHAAFTQTIEGQIAAQRKLNDELDRSIRTQRQSQLLTLSNAKNNLAGEQKSRTDLLGKIARQRAEVASRDETARANIDPYSRSSLALAAEQARDELKKLETQLVNLDASIEAGQRAVREAEVPLIQSDVAASFDAKTAAVKRYEAALGVLNQRVAIGEGSSKVVPEYQGDGTFISKRLTGISTDEYRRELSRITAAREQAEKDAESAKRDTRTSQQVFADFERELNARGIQRAAGRSGHRSAADQNEIFRNGESPLDGYKRVSRHQTDQALDPTRGSHSDQRAREAAQAAGLRGFKIVTESGGRKHYEWSGAGKKGEADVRGSEREMRAGESAAEREASRRKAFESQLDQAQNEFYQAQLALADTIEERADVEIKRLEAAKIQRDLEIDRQVDGKKLTAAEAEKLKAIGADTLELQKIAVERREEAKQVREQQTRLDRLYEMKRAELGLQATVLRFQQDLATTAKERRRIALELLELDLKERRAAAQRKIGSDDPDVRRSGRADLKLIYAEEPYLRGQVERSTQGPFDAYKEQLQRAVGDMDAAFDDVKVHALQNLEDGLMGVIDGTESVGSAFRKMAAGIIADLARIAIQKAILGAISGGIGIFGFAEGGKIEGFASGGRIRGPGTGTSDSILALVGGRKPILVSNGESIVNAEATARYWPLIDAMNKGQLPGFATGGLVAPLSYVPRLPSARAAANDLAPRRPERLELNARVKVDASPLLDARMEAVSMRAVGAAAEPIMAGAEGRTLRSLNRPTLPGGFG